MQGKKSRNEQFLICNKSITLKTTQSPLKSFCFFFWLYHMACGTSPTRDQTHARCIGSTESLGNSSNPFLFTFRHLQILQKKKKKRRKKTNQDTEITIVLHLRENLNSNYSGFVIIYKDTPKSLEENLHYFFPSVP